MIADVIDVGVAVALALGAVGAWLFRRIVARLDSHDERLRLMEIEQAKQGVRFRNGVKPREAARPGTTAHLG